MNCFVVFDGDGIGQMVEKARLSDDLPMVKILSTKIDAGNQVFKLWAESHGTNAIEIGGDEGAVEIPADYLSELSAIKEKYESAVGATVSIGVGMKLSEANRALVYAKVTGKNKICFYTDSMEETLSKLKERSEQEKQGEILGKALPPTKGYWTPMHGGYQEILPEEFDDIHEIPVSNIHRLDYSVHPIDPRRVEGILGADPEKLPPAKGWVGSPKHNAGAYSKLTTDPVDPSYPEVYLSDGHHRAIAATEAKRPLRIAFKWDRPHGRYQEEVKKSTVAMNEGSAAGFSGAHPPAAPTVAKPVATQGEHSEAQSMYDMLAEQKEDHPPTPEATHAEEDIEQSLHQFAAQSDEEDKQSGHERAQRLNAIKSQVVQALQALKAQAPLLEQLKSQAPDTYNAMMGLSNAVIQFARELAPQASTDNLSKSEHLGKMALIHDDAKNPKTVWRVQDEMGNGPYRTASGTVPRIAGRLGDGVYSQPSPVLDFEHHEWMDNPSKREHIFGFEKPEDAVDWFGGANLEDLAEHGFHLQEVPAVKIYRSKSGKQVIFKPHDDWREAMGKKERSMRKAEGVSLEHYSRVPGLKYVDTSHMGTGAPSAEYRQGLPDVPRAYYYRAGSAPEPIVAQGSRARYKASLGPEHRLYDLGEDPENLGPPSRAAFMEGRGKGWSPQDTLLHEVRNRGYYGYYNSRSSQPNTVALFYDHPVEPMDKDEASPVEKRMLPMAEAGTTTKRHHVVLPPGSILGNKIKVQHSDGTESWKQVSSGMIRSQDPSGHPVSSRVPNSR